MPEGKIVMSKRFTIHEHYPSDGRRDEIQHFIETTSPETKNALIDRTLIPAELVEQAILGEYCLFAETDRGEIVAVLYGISDIQNGNGVRNNLGPCDPLAKVFEREVLVIHALAVREDYRRLGIASQLVNMVVEFAKLVRDVNLVRLVFDSSVEGLTEFYKKNNLVVVSDDKLFFRFHLHMRTSVMQQRNPFYRHAYITTGPFIEVESGIPGNVMPVYHDSPRSPLWQPL